MTAVATTAQPQEYTLDLRPLTVFDRIQNAIYGTAGAFAGGGIVTAFYILIFQAVYRIPSVVPIIGGRTFTLSNWWNNWPVLLQLPNRLSGIPVGGTGGFGTWFVSRWPYIQHVFFVSWPIGVLDVAIISLILNRSEGSKTTWFDHMTLWLHTHGLSIVPSRLQPERTTPEQYVFLPVTMLFFGIPGAAVMSTILFGGIALLHQHGISAGILQNTVLQISLLGLSSHLFWASKITMKPARDMQRYFLEQRACEAQNAMACMDEYVAGRISRLAAFRNIAAAKTEPGRLYPPNYQRLFYAMLDAINAGTLTIPDHPRMTRWTMPFYTGLLAILAIVGIYWKFILPAHGGFLP